MNQHYNKNEFEIIDSAVMYSQPRYPLANAPDFEQQNINIDVRTAIVASVKVVGTLLGKFIPGFGMFGPLIDFLWPKDTEATWRAFMSAVEELVDQKINDLKRSEALSRLEGLLNTLKLYQTAASNWEKDPQNPKLQETVRNQFIATNTFMFGSMPMFRVSGFELPMLTMYAEAANLHLLLLQDAVKFGRSWGMDTVTVNSYQSNLETAIKIYTDSCISTYNQGLEQAKTLPADGDVAKWNAYNDYRRDMTLMVLDLVAIWSTYNTTQYPLPVNVQLTREIYTELRGWYAGKLEITEAQLVRPPHLFTFFQSANLYIDYASPFPLGGIQQTVHYPLGANLETAVKGQTSNYLSKVTATPSDAVINRVDTQIFNCVTGLKFYQQYATEPFVTPIWSTFTPGVYPEINMNRIPIEGDQTQANHRMSWISGYWHPVSYTPPYPYNFSCITFGWTHLSADLDNRIYSDSITQIPAVKGYTLEHGAAVVKGPGSTGGDLVRLPAYNDIWTQLRIKMRMNTWGTGKKYKIRIRYASEGAANLFVGRYVDATNSWWETGNYAVKQTFSGSMIYNSFEYLDTFSYTATEPEFKIELRCNSGSSIYIDKIEFIPETPEPPETPVVEGVYQIVTALNNSSVVDLSLRDGIVQLYGNGNASNQKWRFVFDTSKRAYQIRNIANESIVLTWVSPNSVQGITNQSYYSQYWIIRDAGNGYVYLSNYDNPNLVLDVTAGNIANGTPIVAWSFNGGTNQKFKLNKL
ncbi:insecticidal delta-endotoxin Cry8Ea1 family protein [Bacillus cereus]|nr:insecticidal delta-endotoxin Cry8Ea1 family protein [Bacillus cereus]PEA01247.1 hypothetical protein CON37_28990 [Bacillus cereus]